MLAGLPWLDQAACVDIAPEIMFPTNTHDLRLAKKVCAACPVTSECLTYALDQGERFGVWGGTSERERARLSRTNRLTRLLGGGR